MNTLDAAWEWYQSTRSGLQLVSRVARRYWNMWEADSPLARDEVVRTSDPNDLHTRSEAALDQLNDFAVFVLFSGFEAEVRRLILEDTQAERVAVTHPALTYWIGRAETAIEEGSFYTLLESIKAPQWHNEREHVNQVRQYRNWVAHGRRGQRPASVTPTQAFGRLSRLLDILRESPPPA